MATGGIKNAGKTGTPLSSKMKVLTIYSYFNLGESYIESSAIAQEVIEKIAKLTLDDDKISNKWEIIYDPEKSSFLFDCMEQDDAEALKKREIFIELSPDDMPNHLHIIGSRVTIKCDYFNGSKPKLGEDCYIFHDSIIQFSPVLDRKAVEIGNNVIIGQGSIISGYGFIIKDNAIIGGNLFPNYPLEIEEGAYINSGYKPLQQTLIRTVESNGPFNKVGYKASVSNNVILPGYTNVLPFSEIKSNVPLIFQGTTLDRLASAVTEMILDPATI